VVPIAPSRYTRPEGYRALAKPGFTWASRRFQIPGRSESISPANSKTSGRSTLGAWRLAIWS
jgi:hypothetical protein